jgi:hypothetical protein
MEPNNSTNQTNLAYIKSIFFKILMACLVAAAGVAIFTVLVGKFNNVLAKSLGSIAMVALHTLASFSYIDASQKRRSPNALTFLSGAVFFFIVLSFVTSVFGVWSVIPGDIIYKLYATYFVLLFAILHAETLAKTLRSTKSINYVVSTNFVLMTIVTIMIIPIIYISNRDRLGDFYFRALAAAGILDATLTLLAVIMHKQFLDKHPELAISKSEPTKHKGPNLLAIIVIGFLVLQMLPIIFRGLLR